MRALIKPFIVLTFIAGASALALALVTFKDREVIKLRTLNLENTVHQVGKNTAFPAQQTLREVIRDVEQMEKSLGQLALHTKIQAQDLKDERNLSQALQVVQEKLKDSVKSLEVQLAENRSINRRLEDIGDQKDAELLAAQQRIERMIAKEEQQRMEMVELRNQLEARAEEIAGLRADLATEKAFVAQLEKELDEITRPTIPDSEATGIVATVLKVNKKWNSVVIDVGSSQPIKINSPAFVHRGDNYVGMIRIKDLDETSSWGEVDTRMTAAEIRVGDSVVF